MLIRLLLGIGIGVTLGGAMGYFGKCTSGTCPLTANPFRGAVIGALLGTLFAFSYSCRRNESAKEGSEPTKAASSAPGETKVRPEAKEEALIHVNNEADFKKYVLEAELPCLADFFSNSCPPCRTLGPIIEKLAVRYKGKAAVCKVSLDHAETEALPRQYRISGIPTVIFFSKGKETQRLVGLRSEEAYSRVLDEMIKKKGE